MTYPPSVPPYTTMADAALSETALLDVLTQLEDLGFEPRSDGKTVWIDRPEAVSPGLLALMRQCSHQLARLLGNNLKKETPC